MNVDLPPTLVPKINIKRNGPLITEGIKGREDKLNLVIQPLQYESVVPINVNFSHLNNNSHKPIQVLLQINKEKYKNRLKEERHKPYIHSKSKTMNSDQS